MFGHARSDPILTDESGHGSPLLSLAVRIELLLEFFLVAPDQLVDLLHVSHEDERWSCAYIELRDQFLENHFNVFVYVNGDENKIGMLQGKLGV